MINERPCYKFSRNGFFQALACVNRTHIPIQQPFESSHNYFLGKVKYTLKVTRVCDYEGKFIDVDCKWPGRIHSAKVSSNSNINCKLKDGTHLLMYRLLLSVYNKVPVLLLVPYFVKEYTTCTANEQVMFNSLLKASRNPIECGYGDGIS